MSNILEEVLSANKSYTEDFGDKAQFLLPSGRH